MSLLGQLPEGPLAIIGDVHGEFDALIALLEHPDIGFGPIVRAWKHGREIRDLHKPERTLIFVGDLIDRGPDSPQVVSLVLDLMDAELALCIVGNHELNLVLGDNDRENRPGTGWFSGRSDDHFEHPTSGKEIPFDAVRATPKERERFTERLDLLPVILERADLSIVHACWDPDAIEAIRHLPEDTSVSEAFHRFEERLVNDPDYQRAMKLGAEEIAPYREGLRSSKTSPPPAEHVRNYIEGKRLQQNGNPIKVLTSGLERAAREAPVFKEKWRLLERVRWWEEHDGPVVIVGHYWRTLGEHTEGPWKGVDPLSWLRGRVFCIDYSIGRSFRERVRPPADSSDALSLAAMLWPAANHSSEGTTGPRLVFSNRPPLHTYGLVDPKKTV